MRTHAESGSDLGGEEAEEAAVRFGALGIPHMAAQARALSLSRGD